MRRNQAVEKLLDDSEAQQQCAYAANRATRQAMHYRASQGLLMEPAQGIFARKEFWEGLPAAAQVKHACKALHKKHPSLCFTGPTAAVIYGFETPYRAMQQPYVCVGYGREYVSHGVRYIHSSSAQAVTIDGIKVASVEQTLIDSALVLEFPYALAIFDSAARKGANMLAVHRAAQRKRQPIEKVLQVLRYVDARSENGGESVARGTIISLGFMAPLTQVEFYDAETGKIYRVDFLWCLPNGELIAGEFDGSQKYQDPKMLGSRTLQKKVAEERARDAALARCGITRVIHFTPSDVRRVAPIKQKLEQGGIPLASEVNRFALQR